MKLGEKDMECACGKVARYKEHLKFNGYDIDGWECKDCKEAYYNPEKAERILLLNKLKKQAFKLRLSQAKSNLILRIPKEASDAFGLKKGETVEFSIKDDKMVICPVN